MRSQILVLAGTLVLAGCASQNANKWSCNAPEQGQCMSAEDVYNETMYGDDEPIKAAEDSTGQADVVYNPDVHMPFVAIEADKPVPIRVPSKTMRIFLSSYEDINGYLYSSFYTFQDIEQRQWVTGNTNVTTSMPYVSTPLY